MKILIVDTDFEITETVQIALSIKQTDWEIYNVNSNEQCLKQIKTCDYLDMVIIEIGNSNNSSLNLLTAIRDDSNIPVIILSDDENIETLVNAFDAGANDFITMPFNSSIFIARLEALIRRQKDFQKNSWLK